MWCCLMQTHHTMQGLSSQAPSCQVLDRCAFCAQGRASVPHRQSHPSTEKWLLLEEPGPRLTGTHRNLLAGCAIGNGSQEAGCVPSQKEGHVF